MEDMIQDYHDNNDVVYTLMASVNGEVVQRYTSSISFDDVAGYAALADTKMQETILADATDAAEDAGTDARIEEMKGA